MDKEYLDNENFIITRKNPLLFGYLRESTEERKYNRFADFCTLSDHLNLKHLPILAILIIKIII